MKDKDLSIKMSLDIDEMEKMLNEYLQFTSSSYLEKDATFNVSELIEIINVLRSKRDEIIFKMKLTSKEETDILIKRVENLEKKINKLEKKSPNKKFTKVKKS